MSHITSQEWSKWDLIHPLVYSALLDNKFTNPTDIQAYVLNCYRNYNDFLIASQTGSGKTLSFGIPIVSEIIYEKTGAFKSSQNNPKHGTKYIRCLIIAPTRELVLQIEKHLNQISQNAKEYIRIGSIVGGISKDKQRRVLGYVPDILIATPGRLWDMIDNCEGECLDNLHLSDYLVLDEADRMVELGHFDELDKILEKVYNKGEIIENKADIERINQLVKENKSKTIQLKSRGMNVSGLESLGENEVMTIQGDEALKFLQQLKDNNSLDAKELKGINLEALNSKSGKGNSQNKEGKGGEEEDWEDEDENEDEEDEGEGENEDEDDEDEGEDEEQEGDEDDEEDDGDDEDEEEDDNDIDLEEDEEIDDEKEDDDKIVDEENLDEEDGNEDEKNEDENNLDAEDNENKDEEEGDEEEEDDDKKKKNIKRKVFLVSATLTKQFAGNKHKIKTLSKKEKVKENKARKDRKKGLITEEKEGKMIPKLEALMNKVKFTSKHKVIDLTSTLLIPKNLVEVKTVCTEEDKPLYLYHYITQRVGQSFLIFTNSISYAKKILHLLTILGLKVLCLHSEMQQRQRLKKLDQFKDGVYHILVSTDVAARGLDIPSVQNVIHYQVPMDVDTFIHRSGRTARIGKAGTCYTLIGPKDGQRFQKIINQLSKEQGIKNIEINHTERDRIRVVIDSASQLERSDFLVRQKQVEKQWYSKNSKLAELDVDEEIEQEIGQINEELTKKRVIMKNDRQEFKKVKDDLKQVNRRPNNMFLEPSQIAKFTERLELLKKQKQQQGNRPKFQHQQQQQQQQQKQQNNKNAKQFQKKSKKNNDDDDDNHDQSNNRNHNSHTKKKRRFSQR